MTFDEDHTLYSDVARLHSGCEVGPRWAELAERVSHLPLTDPMRMAYTLTLRRLHQRSPVSSHFDPSCPACASHLLARFEGSEQELIDQFCRTLAEVEQAVSYVRHRRRDRRAA